MILGRFLWSCWWRISWTIWNWSRRWSCRRRWPARSFNSDCNRVLLFRSNLFDCNDAYFPRSIYLLNWVRTATSDGFSVETLSSSKFPNLSSGCFDSCDFESVVLLTSCFCWWGWVGWLDFLAPWMESGLSSFSGNRFEARLGVLTSSDSLRFYTYQFISKNNEAISNWRKW